MKIHSPIFIVIIMVILAFPSGCGENQSPATTNNAKKMEPAIAETINQDKITCDKFKIDANLSDDTINVALDTDLPDYTVVMVSVSRGYKEKGDSAEYSIDYILEKSTVGNWRSEHSIKVSDDVFKQEMQKKMDLMAKLGEPFEIGATSDNIEVSFIVPINQDHPSFGRGNENLIGSRVSETGIRVVEAEEVISKPLGARGASPRPQYGHYENLEVGKSYLLSKETPLMPEFEPSDPLEAISRAIKLQAGTNITIIERKMRGSTPWYRVRASSGSGSRIGEGWINSIALIGQELRLK